MKLLALDTTTDACSVAVCAGDDVHCERLVEARAHTRELVPMIQRQLRAAGLAADALDAIVLGNGPGSFIGLRIGASVAQGIAFAAGLKIVPVSSLAAVAAEVFAGGEQDTVAVAQDARMGEIYIGHFSADGDGLPVQLGDTRLVAAESLEAGEMTAVAGGAWSRHPILADSLPATARVLPVEYPDARHLLGVGRRELAAGRTVAPAELEPGYVRQKVASVPGRKADSNV